jgi:hypothetical protein
LNTTSRARFDATYVPLQQARPQRLDTDQVVNLWIGRRPRRSLRARMGWIWSRFNAASWRDPFLIVLWIGVLLSVARIGGLL